MTHDGLGLFDGYGVEIEYMIVDRDTLAVRPIADRLIAAAAGEVAAEVARGPLMWSNELVLHVLELKTNGPVAGFDHLADLFQEDVAEANRLLEPMNAQLLPTGMHPTMDPATETRLWPHEYTEVYRTFDRIFDCRGHGWANLQSTHLNLAFDGDDEFRRLHEALRIILPLLPALAASSPLIDGRISAYLDTRLSVYRDNARRVPSVSGLVVPESVRSRQQYESEILERIYRDLTPLDPDGILHHEWVNARGAIPRFDRGAIEVRVLDTQECPAADLGVLATIVTLVRSLVARDDQWRAAASAFETRRLAAVLDVAIADGGEGRVGDAEYLALLGVEGSTPSLGEVWDRLVGGAIVPESPEAPVVRFILDHGCLAHRIRRAIVGCGGSPSAIADVYRHLASCLAAGQMFVPE